MSRKKRFIIAVLLVGLGVCLAAPLLLFPLLPGYLEQYLSQRFQHRFADTEFRLDVRRVGITGIDLGELEVGPPARPALSWSALQLDFSPAGLFKKRIKRLVVSGLTVRTRYLDNRLTLAGLDRPLADRLSGGGPPRETGIVVPVMVGEVVVRGATLLLDSPLGTVRLPFELTLRPAGDQPDGRWNLVLDLFPAGRGIRVTALVDPPANRVDLSWAGSLSLAAVAPFLDQVLPGMRTTGDLGLSGRAALGLRPFQLNEVNAAGEINNTSGVSFAAFTVRGGPSRPARLTVHGQGPDWRVEISDLALVQPTAATLAGGADIRIDPGGVSAATGALEFTPGSTIGSADIFSIAVAPLKFEFSAGYGPDTGWRLDATGTTPRLSGASEGGLTLAAGRSELKVTSHGRDAEGGFDFSFLLPEVSLRLGRDLTATLPLVRLTGTAGSAPDEQSGLTLDGRLRFDKARIRDSGKGLEFTGIRGDAPFRWPGREKGAAGELAIKSISWKGRKMGAVAATLYQAEQGLRFSGLLDNGVVPGLRLEFSGDVGPGPAGIAAGLGFSIPAVTIVGFRPDALFPAAPGLSVGGELRARGELALSGSRLSGSLAGNIRHGRLENREKKLLIEDIALDLSLPLLPRIRSAPEQQLTFSRASLGDLKFGRSTIAFQIESPSSLFIEKSDFSWCQGHVYAYGLRLHPDDRDFDITLYCDRLHLAQVLNQFGIAQVQGQGTVNGRIPLGFRGGRFNFDNGFLYSSPGEGGLVRMGAADLLFAGIPRNTPRFAQIDFAAAALKDFRYNWVRLLFQSDGEDLVVRMRLDGKPAKPLPFAYRRDLGSFVRLEVEGSGTGILQPILLDVNFRLPLNTILGYSGNISDVLKKMQ
ncbi:MAG: YdbH domain-containing protein [Desulfobacterales bacterium]|nr:YdbH domain-containing protein [Desulfobacterales bacterium]